VSPLIHEHINTQGRHSFVMPEAVAKRKLRPLRRQSSCHRDARFSSRRGVAPGSGAGLADSVRETIDPGCGVLVENRGGRAGTWKETYPGCFMRRFDAEYQRLRKLITSGELGELLMLHCSHRNSETPREFTNEMLINDSVVHEFDAIRYLTGLSADLVVR
jgi:hypothetical protein